MTDKGSERTRLYSLNGKPKHLFRCELRTVKENNGQGFMVKRDIPGCGFFLATCGPIDHCPKCHEPAMVKIEGEAEWILKKQVSKQNY